MSNTHTWHLTPWLDLTDSLSVQSCPSLTCCGLSLPSSSMMTRNTDYFKQDATIRQISACFCASFKSAVINWACLNPAIWLLNRTRRHQRVDEIRIVGTLWLTHNLSHHTEEQVVWCFSWLHGEVETKHCSWTSEVWKLQYKDPERGC